MRSINRRLSAPKATPKRFGSIPLDARKINRNQLGALVGRVIGGTYKNAKRPWESRRIVRDIFKKTGHLDTIKERTKYREKEVVQMLKDFRAELKGRRKEAGYGLSEQGDYYGKREKDVYRKFVEETYNQAQAPSRDEQRQRDLEIRIIKARRRELQRETLGLTPISVARRLNESHTKAEVGKSEARRANLEQRLDAVRDATLSPSAIPKPTQKKHETAGHQTGDPQQQNDVAETKKTSPTKGAVPAPLFSSAVHLPPRHAEVTGGESEAQADQSSGEEDQARPPAQEKSIPIEKIRAMKQEKDAAGTESLPKEPDDGQLFAA